MQQGSGPVARVVSENALQHGNRVLDAIGLVERQPQVEAN